MENFDTSRVSTLYHLSFTSTYDIMASSGKHAILLHNDTVARGREVFGSSHAGEARSPGFARARPAGATG